jgi:hypothetical protein
MQYRVKWTKETCFKCSNYLMAIEPDRDGWQFYCPFCEHLTSRRADLIAALEGRPKGAAGIVAAVPCKMLIGEDK